VYTGPGAGTESGPQTGIALMASDSAADNPTGSPVAPGTNSFEKWLAVVVDDPEGSTFSTFWVECSGVLPDGVTIRVGAADSGATPTSATSTVAKTTLSAGRRFTWDDASYDTAGQRTRYLVLQESVAATAAAGAIPQQALTFGFVKG
jgi:hypothetical protein